MKRISLDALRPIIVGDTAQVKSIELRHTGPMRIGERYPDISFSIVKIFPHVAQFEQVRSKTILITCYFLYASS